MRSPKMWKPVVALVAVAALAAGGSYAGSYALFSAEKPLDLGSIQSAEFSLTQGASRATLNGTPVAVASLFPAPGDTVVLERDVLVWSSATNARVRLDVAWTAPPTLPPGTSATWQLIDDSAKVVASGNVGTAGAAVNISASTAQRTWKWRVTASYLTSKADQWVAATSGPSSERLLLGTVRLSLVQEGVQ